MTLLWIALGFVVGLAALVFLLAWLMRVRPGEQGDDFRSGNRPFRPI